MVERFLHMEEVGGSIPTPAYHPASAHYWTGIRARRGRDFRCGHRPLVMASLPCYGKAR